MNCKNVNSELTPSLLYPWLLYKSIIPIMKNSVYQGISEFSPSKSLRAGEKNQLYSNVLFFVFCFFFNWSLQQLSKLCSLQRLSFILFFLFRWMWQFFFVMLQFWFFLCFSHRRAFLVISLACLGPLIEFHLVLFYSKPLISPLQNLSLLYSPLANSIQNALETNIIIKSKQRRLSSP